MATVPSPPPVGAPVAAPSAGALPPAASAVMVTAPPPPAIGAPIGAPSTGALPPAASALHADDGSGPRDGANSMEESEITPVIPDPPLSDEEILQNLLKEEEQLTNENVLLSDYILRIAASKATALSDISEETTESSDDENLEYASRSSMAQSLLGRGSILEGVASRRGSSAGYPGLRAPSVTKTEASIPQSTIQVMTPVLNAEEKNEIATEQCAAMKEELENCISENERILDELRAAFDEASLRIGEVRRDRADFQRDVLADAKAKGAKKGSADKILKFMEQKLSKKFAKALKVRERNAALNLQIAKTEQLLANKKELADLLHAVDFEQLQIHKQQNLQRLRERLHELNRLKASNAKATEALDYQSWQLSSHIRRRYWILEQLVEREPQLAHVRKDIARVTKKKDRLEESFHIFIQERDAQLGEAQPNVLEYMEWKERVHNLRLEHRTWSQKVEVVELCSQQPSAHQSERDAFSVKDMLIGQAVIQAQSETAITLDTN